MVHRGHRIGLLRELQVNDIVFTRTRCCGNRAMGKVKPPENYSQGSRAGRSAPVLRGMGAESGTLSGTRRRGVKRKRARLSSVAVAC